MKRDRISRVAAAALLALSLAACSTRPKAPTESFETRNRAAEYAKLADGFYGRGQWDSALSFYEEAIKASASVDHVEGAAIARASLGRTLLAAGRVAEAEAELGGAYDYAKSLGLGPAASLAASGLGEALYRRGEAEAALARFEEAALLAGGDEGALAVALHDAATTKIGLGREAEGRADLERAAALNLKRKRWTEYGANRYLLASLLLRAGEAEAALAAASEALEADRRAENGRGIALDLAALGSITRRMGRPREAYWWWRRSFDTALAANEAAVVRRALQALRELSEELGRGEAEAASWAELLGRLDAAEAAGAAGSGD